MPGPDVRAPSLLISASFHRSGSTLLQRYVSAVTDIFVWGENGWLMDSLRRAHDAWPKGPHNVRDYRQAMADPSTMQRIFVPNLAPPAGHVLQVFRRTIMDLYAGRPPSHERWGWKAVRYGRNELEFARRLFPDLDIVLLVRDPWDVARSVRRKGWIDRRGYFEDISQVATHWTERTAYYRDLADANDDRVHLVQYEMLDDRISALDEFLDIGPEVGSWDAISRRKLGATPSVSRFDLTPEDVGTINDIAGEVAEDLGYSAPSNRRPRFGASR
ncbi:MAG: sulfotransferase [Gemmatimonadota bacterium]|nr:sulfotransferase [Gemmatimonadota bacterium]